MLRRIALVVALVAAGLVALPAARVSRAAVTPTSASVAWTAPGDDDQTGTATRYDVRLSTAAIDASNFAAAQVVTGVPAPLVAGSLQSMNLTGLSPGTAYWCALKTVDDAGNWSAISNVLQFTTPAASDSVRPAPLTLVVSATGAGSVSLTWTATGDDSLTGNASLYDMRWSTTPITGANFLAATRVTAGVPAPGTPGVAQGCTVTALNRSVDLYFAARVADEYYNWSSLSNVVFVPLELDASPPATPTGLVAASASPGVHLAWTPNGDPDLAGYHVYRAISAGGPFTRLDNSLLGAANFVDASAPDSASLWYAVSAVDASNNESARSAAVVYSADLAQVAGLSSTELQPVYPNPSGVSDPVTLPVAVPAGGPVEGRIDIVNSAGERIRTIPLAGLAPGITQVTWDGHNNAGRATAPGVYRALLTVGGKQQAVRLVRR